MDLREKNKLLYARAGFGISLEDYEHPLPVEEVVTKLFPKAKPGDLEMITDEEWAEHNPRAMKEVKDEMERKEIQKSFRKRAKDINLLWHEAMVYTSYPLMEKTALFWHGHFATRLDNPYYDQKLLNVFRRNALGNFGDMLREVSKSPAMIQLLNNRQNKKQHPNENFAREVMELFTLGRGHYTEDDVKEAARAFTGWSIDDYGDFFFNTKQHDFGEKKFLGRTGNFNGDDILNILLEQKQTAIFITQKVYRYYVSDEKIDGRHVAELANDFHNSNYDISNLLRNIFTAGWFYDGRVQGAKIKSPIELLVGYQRMLPMEFGKDDMIINLQKVLGQYLFNPPNVAGWPGGKSWIDSSSLIIRMRLPEALFRSAEMNFHAKQIVPDMQGGHDANNPMNASQEKPFKIARADTDWDKYISYWKKHAKEELPKNLAGYLLPVTISQEQLGLIVSYADNSSDDEYIKSLTILIMELPEYQLV
jgi:uncharacterized protein (DUF1800 family)